ncbi:hypothetical protein RYX41_15060 [Lactiplantibacillus plantarum]|nr:hypothetical protein [Lactiplantibacillus plantarum]
MNEQQLIHLAADGDDASINALAQQYVPVVWRLRRQYYVRNFDEDDWLQEGRIAVYRAAKSINGYGNVALALITGCY